jgi:hypothetical protein
MNIELIRNKIERLDWKQYCGPEYYEPIKVAPALLDLLNLENPAEANSVGDNVLFSIGNNHAGTYYPVILSALDIIISIEQEASDSVRRICAQAILDDLSCFELDPDLGSFSDKSFEEISEITQTKLEPYYDET